MGSGDYDFVIVGARCAGATLATLAARAGARVLLLDKDALPSDCVLSTHLIGPAGIDVLDEVGVGPAVRAVTPPVRRMRMNADGARSDIEFPADRAAYCPRRERLDGLLQRAAVGAGAELLDRTRVVSLVWQDGRVTGVRAASDGRRGPQCGHQRASLGAPLPSVHSVLGARDRLPAFARVCARAKPRGGSDPWKLRNREDSRCPTQYWQPQRHR